MWGGRGTVYIWSETKTTAVQVDGVRGGGGGGTTATMRKKKKNIIPKKKKNKKTK